MTETYSGDEPVDLRGYAGSMLAYAGLTSAALVAGRRSGKSLPERYRAMDLVVGGVAIHKLSRLISKGSVTSPLRAPFTTLEEATGAGEHLDASRGDSGVRHTIGQLLSCPFCLAVWLSTGYVAGLALVPRGARAGAAVFTIVAMSDSLQLGYEVLRKHALEH